MSRYSEEFSKSDTFEFVVERATVEEGKTFSQEAMVLLFSEISEFIMTRVMVRWDETNEPPTALTVHVQVEAR